MARVRIPWRGMAAGVAVVVVGGLLWWTVSAPAATQPHDTALANVPVGAAGSTPAAGSTTGSPSPSSSASGSASRSASAGASASPKRAKATPKASKNTAVAVTIALPPAPHNPGTVPTTSPSATSTASAAASASATAKCPSYAGTDAAKTDVAAALSTAASTPRSFTYTDSAAASHTVGITVPDVLIKAIAWQESGWQSQITACDGGFGTMQIMSGTATWMNNRFGTSFDYKSLSGNTQIGSEYLEWLIAYFGQVYYADDFDLSANQSLLNDVVSAYNVGPGNVNPTATSSGIVNPKYVANVEALESLQPWNN